MIKLLLNYWPPFLQRKLSDEKAITRALCNEWAACDTYIENLCLKFGISEDDVYGNSYYVPSIEEKVDMLIKQIESHDQTFRV